MKSFYEMLVLMEGAAMASVERFPQDFEQVLNFIAGGHWGFVTNQSSPFYGMDIDKPSGNAVFYIRAEYRGMSESGRHYRVAVRLVSVPEPPIDRDGWSRFEKWKQEFVSYNPNGSPLVHFDLDEVAELGPDTDGRSRPKKDNRTDWEREEEERSLTPQQRQMRTLIGKLGSIQADLEKDSPRLKWTLEHRVYFRGDNGVKHPRPVGLAKQVREEIGKHEKENAGFDS